MANDRPQKNTLLNQTRRKIVNWLVDEQIKPGEKLPSKRDFSTKYKVGEITVLNAINSLVDVGVLRTVPSRGTYLVSSPRRPVLIDAYFPETWRETILCNNVSHHSYYLYRSYLDGLILSSSEFDAALTIEYIPTSELESIACARQTLTRDGAIFFIYGKEELFSSLEQRGVPFAHITTGKSMHNNEIGAAHDNAIGVALQKLRKQGCKTAGMIDFPKNQGKEKDITESSRAKLEKFDFKLEDKFIHVFSPFISYEKAFDDALSFLKTLKDLPDIFVAGSSYQLCAFLRASESLGLNLFDVSFLTFGSRLAFDEPNYKVLFCESPYFKQSYKAIKKLTECARGGQCVFSGEDIEAEMI